MKQEEIGQHFEDNASVQPSLHPDRQAFSRELVDDAQHAERYAVMRLIHHEVVTPYMIAVLRP